MAEPLPGGPERYRPTAYQSTNLVDILDRVLDKGLVIAGDISVSLANVELLTIRIRLLICSIDKAEQIGLNWWRYDRYLVQPTEPADAAATITQLEARIADLERRLAGAQPDPSAPAPEHAVD
ncbi:MAG: gas vesicle protein [Chloroflexota bacterium]